MPAIRAESASVVSMPPREKMAARRRARAIKLGLGLPSSVVGKSPGKRTRKTAKAPVPPTLAAMRERRKGVDRAYLNRADGFHIKRVVRRAATPEHAPPVAYLSGQEDAESDTDDFNDMTPNVPQMVPRIPFAAPSVPHTVNHNGLGGHLNVSAEADDLLDYDAEGEDDDDGEPTDSDMDMDIDDFSFGGDLNCPSANAWDHYPPSAQSLDLLANASEEDIQALFSGFDSLRFNDESASLDNSYFQGDFDSFNPPAAHTWSDVNGSLGSGSGSRLQPVIPGLGAQEPFAVRQLDAAADHLYTRGPTPHFANHPTVPTTDPSINATPRPLAINAEPSHSTHAESPRPPLPPLRRLPTPAPWVSIPEVQITTRHPSVASTPPQPTPLPPVRRVAPYASASRASTPSRQNTPSRAPAFARPLPPLRTSQQASRVHKEAGPSRPRHSPPAPAVASPTLAYGSNLTGLESENSEGDSDNSDAPRASTPVDFDDTDIGLTESASLPTAARWTNLQRPRQLPRPTNQGRTVPTFLELRANARQHFAMTARKTRIREPAPLTQPLRDRGPLRSSEMTPNQLTAKGPMEYNVYMNLVCNNPWPQDRDAVLEEAKEYAIKITGIDGPDVFTQRFMDAIYYRMPANRGDTLPKMDTLTQQEFSISVADKPEIQMYLDKDNFLYPTIDRDENQKFRVHIIGSALLVILFECGKALAYVFMEELNKVDDARKCAEWHGKARDRTARSRGIPPGLIAYAATQIHWALAKLDRGGSLQFHEHEFRRIWAGYHRDLLKLKHLGQLRMELLELVRNHYLERWPGRDRDSDNDDSDEEGSTPAW
ncbi:hypothetical protein FRC09_003064 [Ceratobasidium sp. 395]|nr:hypothetical protein FRC09_003064 [Ceratobasidium sp. 395]